MQTKITYGYRDAANNRREGVWIVKGMCSQSQAEHLRKACLQEDGHYYFVPTVIGMPDIIPTPWDDELDHPMCTIEDIEMVGEAPDDERTMHGLIEEFRSHDWEMEAAQVTKTRSLSTQR